MSGSPSRRSSASDTPVSSVLSRAPRFSPPSSRTVSPIRRPLHDRSNSQTNQYVGPTIRIVGEDHGSNAYTKNPFPSSASQILPPRKVPGYAFERRGSHVSDTVAKIEASQASQDASHTLVPRPLQQKKIRQSTSTYTSEADTFVETLASSSISPSSARFSQDSTTRASPTPDSLFRSHKLFEVLQEVPSSPSRSTIRAVTPSTSSSAEAPPDAHALTPRASVASLASTGSNDSSAQLNSNNKRDSSHISFSPAVDKRSKLTPSGSKNKKQASSNTKSQRPISEASAHSLATTDYSFNSERLYTGSHPVPAIHEARTATVTYGVQVNYPIVRAPSSSSLWASTQDQLPTISSRMQDRGTVHQWSSQLSTIHSESERESRSIERGSPAYSVRSQSQDDYAGSYPGPGRASLPRRRQTIGSVSSSDNVSSDDSSVAVPLPLFSPLTGASHDERESDERHDTISPLQSPPLRMKTSFRRRWDSDSRSTTSSSRPSSSQSDLSTFIATTIPAWARVYYRRGERGSLGAPESSTESSSERARTSESGRTNTPSERNFPLSIYRPRNRPHQRISQADTFSTSEGPAEHGIYVVQSRMHNMDHFSPHLRPDRRSQAQLSAWKTPSFDENMGTMLFSRQNRQILCFCLGFIFPFAWMIASVLPLPPDPDLIPRTASEDEVERQFEQQFGLIVDKSHQKANWWRNLNRIMSGVGTLLIGVIVALAVLAAKMS